MNTRLIHYAAALLASAAATLAAAQPANTPFADEAIASAAKGDQGGQAVNAVVQALNAEASLKNAKITVA